MKITRLSQAYDFPGFKALTTVRELSADPLALVVTLQRRYKKKGRNVRIVVRVRPAGTTTSKNGYATILAGDFGCILNLTLAASSAGSAG